MDGTTFILAETPPDLNSVMTWGRPFCATSSLGSIRLMFAIIALDLCTAHRMQNPSCRSAEHNRRVGILYRNASQDLLHVIIRQKLNLFRIPPR
jgi:hypothetical protein